MSVAAVDETAQAHEAMWLQRVKIISDKFYRKFPESLKTQINGGTALAKHRQNFRRTGRHWEVEDRDAQQWYPFNATCPCPGFKVSQDGWCKHRTAVTIFLEARELPEDQLRIDPATYSPPTVDEATDEILRDEPIVPAADTWQQEEAAEQAARVPAGLAETEHEARMTLLTQVVEAAVQAVLGRQPPALPEAPASVNLHLTIDGRQVQLTLRDTDEARLLQRLAAVMAQYPRPEPSPAAAVSQAEPAEAAQETEAPDEHPDTWCETCHKPMKWRRPEGQAKGWYSHKVGDLWCRGKGPGVWVP